MLLYLSDVQTARDGCMAVLRHNATRATFKMDGAKIWGPAAAPASVPREWLSEMFARGYRPECLKGAAVRDEAPSRPARPFVCKAYAPPHC